MNQKKARALRKAVGEGTRYQLTKKMYKNTTAYGKETFIEYINYLKQNGKKESSTNTNS